MHAAQALPVRSGPDGVPCPGCVRDDAGEGRVDPRDGCVEARCFGRRAQPGEPRGRVPALGGIGPRWSYFVRR